MRRAVVESYRDTKSVAARLLADSPELGRSDSERLRKEWRLRDLATRLARTKSHDELFEALERLPLEQARFFGGFERPSRDLESVGLAAAAEGRDWLRFLVLAMRALELRSLAGLLADADVLEALLVHGGGPLAKDVAAQLRDPVLRARAAAIVAVAAEPPASDAVALAPEGDALEDLVDRLEAVRVSERRDGERWLEVLLIVAKRLPHAMGPHWRRWIGRLAPWPDLALEAWGKLAEGWLQADAWHGPEFRCVLEGLGSRAGEVLVEAATLSPRHLDEVLALLEEDAAWADVADRLRLLRLGIRVAEGRSLPCEASRWLADRTPCWTPDLVEAGKLIWPRLEARSLDELRAALRGSPAAEASLEAILAEANAPTASADRLFAALDAVDDEAARFHGALRWLEASGEVGRRRQILATLARHLFGRRYELADGDFVTFLDQVAELLPTELRDHLEGGLRRQGAASPAPGSADRLRALARDATQPVLRELLFAEAERWAALAGRDELEGFSLRAELLRALAASRARRRGGLAVFAETASRVLPSEEDGLREAIALATADRGEAMEVARPIGDAALRLRTALRVVPDPATLGAMVEPENLLAVAEERTRERMRAEVEALGVLLEVPREAAALAERLGAIRDTDRRILGAFELVEHALEFQRMAYGPRQRDFAGAAQPLGEALAAGGGERLRLGLLPELAGLAAGHAPRGHEQTEWRGAWLETLRLASVPWHLRLEVLERLVFDLLRGLDATATTHDAIAHSRGVAAAIAWASGPASTLGSGDAATATLREHLHEVIPILVAAVESAPGWVGLRVAYPFASRVVLGPLLSWIGTDYDRLVRSIEGLAPVVDGVPWRAAPWTARHAPAPPGGSHHLALDLALAHPHERSARLDALLDGSVPYAADLWTAILPLVRGDARRLALLFDRVAPAEARAAALRLARAGRLGAAAWRVVERALGAEAATARVWEGVWEPTSVDTARWLRDLASRVGEGDFDPFDPAHLPIVRRLRRVPREDALVALAPAVSRALERGGEAGGVAALSWWLRAYLATRLGVGDRLLRDRFWTPLASRLWVERSGT